MSRRRIVFDVVQYQRRHVLGHANARLNLFVLVITVGSSDLGAAYISVTAWLGLRNQVHL